MRRRAGLVIALVALVLVVARIAAGATVTAPTNGQNLSADLAQNSSSGAAFTTLNNIVISESANPDIPANLTNGTYILNAPTNWRFSAGNGSVSFTASRDITAASIAVTASTITVTITTDNNANRSDAITISGIRVQLIDGAQIPSTGNITAGGGSFTIAGINGSTNFGTLSAVAGNRTKLGITSVNGGSSPTAGTGFAVVVRSQDQFGNPANVVAATGVSLSLATGTGTLGGTLTGTIAAGGNQVTISGVTYTKAESSVSITATRTSGDTLTAGTSATFTVNPGALSNFLVEAQGGGSIGTQTAGTNFNIRITARDALNNTVTAYTGTVDITSTGTLAAGGGTTAAFTAGVLASHTVRISNTGSFTITATRTSGGSENGTSNSFTVNPGALSNFLVEAQGGGSIGTQTAGTNFNIRITARDALNNTVTAYTGTVDITSTGTLAAGGGTTAAFTAGVLASHTVRISNTGSFTITATRTSGGSENGTSNSFTVNPGAASKLAVTSVPAQAATGSTFSVTVQSQDANGNPSPVVAATGISLAPSGAGTLSGNTDTVGAGTHTKTLTGVSYDTAGSITLTASRTSGDALASSAPSSAISIVARPTSTVTFPTAGNHNAAAWAAGCATAGFCGTASESSGSGLAAVELSVRRGTGNYWDGSGFNSASEVFLPASLAGSNWSYAFGAGSFGADGTYSIRVRATDNIGGVQLPLTSVTFTYDATAPSTVVSFPAAGGTYGAGSWASPSGTAADATAGLSAVELSIRRTSTGNYWDGSGFTSGSELWHAASGTASWSLSFPLSNFGADGDYVVRVRSVDNANNMETPTSRTVTIDTAAPDTSISAAPSDPSNDPAPSFTFSSNESGATFECKLDAGAYAACTSPKTYAGVADGSHTFSVRALDAAGNTDGSPATHTWTIDTAAPAAPSITGSSPASPANDNGPELLGTAEAGSTVRIYTDATCTSAVAASGGAAVFGAPGLSVTVGDNTITTFYATATDAAGNTSGCSTPAFTYEEYSTPPTPTGLAVSPASPANENNPFVSGNSTPGLTIRVYTTADCSGAPVATGTSAEFAVPGLAVAVGDDSTTPFRATAEDGAGNVSACSAPVTYVEDSTPPAAPSGLDSSPGSPASDNDPELTGSATAGSTVRLYTTSDCSGAAAASGSAASFASPGLTVSVADDSSTSFRATATDSAGNTSTCSAPHTYVEDSSAPAAPSGLATTPGSPANDNDPELTGSAEAGSIVRVYTTNDCSGAPAASGSAATFGGPGLAVSVGNDSTTTFKATATDGAGNTSACSSGLTYVEDSTPPAAPSALATTPTSPSNVNNLDVTGAAEAGSTVRVYTTSDCSGAPLATGSAATFGGSGLSATVAADSTTTFKATATDAAGNTSACSSGVIYVEDSTAPGAPTGLGSSPASPANDNDPELTGGVEAGSTVRIFSTTDCSGAPVATGGAGAFTGAGLSVNVADDSSTTFTATATDAAGNASTCSALYSYVEDSTAPAAPSGLGSTPPSPTNANSAVLTGSADAGTTVRLYTTNDCSGAPAASGTAASFGGAGIGVTVSDDSTTTFKATATDGAGNTSACSAGYSYVEDSTLPASTVAFPTAGGVYRAATWADFTGTASDVGSGLARVELSIERLADGQFWNGSAFSGSTEDWRTASGAASWSYSFPVGNYASDGQYRVRVRAVDDAGNAEAPSSRTYTIDRVAPNTTIDSGPADPSNDVNPSFTFSSEPGATFECSLDGGAAASCTSPKSYSSLAEVSHTFSVTATDVAGNVEATPATQTWTLDTTNPSTTYSFPGAGGSYNQAGWNDFGGSATDTGGAGLQRVELSVRSVASGAYWDGSAFASGTAVWHTASGTASWTLAFPAANFAVDGDYEVRARAVDNATNTSGALLRSFSVDTVPPETTVDSGPSGNTASADATFTFSSDQAGSTFACRLDGGSWAACASPRSYTGLAEGSHTFDVRATDAGGNSDPTEASRTWFVDTMLPTATLDSPPSWMRQTVTLTATATDSGSGVASVRFDRSPAGAGTWTPLGTDTSAPYSNDFDTTSVANGLYDLRVVATDGAGNFQSSSVVTNIHVDNTAPNAVLDDPGAAVAGTVALTHSSTDADSGIDTVQFQYRALPTGAWTDTGASWDTTALTDGQHELRVRVTDRAGNSATSAVATTLVDNTVPTVAFTIPMDGGFVNAASNDPLTLTASANDLGSGVNNVEFFACTAGGPSCTSSTSLGVDSAGPYEAGWPLPADGTRYLKATATDNAARQATVVIGVTVDRTVPDTNLLSNPGTPSNNPTPSFTFDSNEAGATFECRVDGGGWSICATPHTTTALADGNHTFDVRAVDAAANADPTPATWSWLVDATAPSATMDDPGPNLRLPIGLTSSQSDPGAFASGIASVQYEYSVANAETWVGTAAVWDTTTVADGNYDVHVVVTDNAGNVTTSTAVEDRRIDNTAPATSHDDPGANMRQTVTLVGQASDAGSGVQQVDFQISPTGANSWTTIGAATGVPYQIGFDTTTYADGLYDFRTVARDVAGNQTDGAPVLSRRIDNTPPIASMNDPGAYLRGTVNLTSVADDPGGSGVSSVVYEYSPTGANAWQPMSATWATDTVADGVYDLHVVVRDVAGNETISGTVAGRRVDNTAPTTGHNAPSGWQSGSVTVSLGPDDAGGSGVTNTQFAVDGGGWQSGTSVSISSDGIHTISFFSTDAAGNVESPKTATVMIDSTPPPPGANDPGNYLRGDVTLSANADTGGTGAPIANVTFQYSPASAGTWSGIGVDTDSPYSVTWSTTSVVDGAYDLRFEVTDEATPPNVSTEDLASKIVDNTAPTASMGSPLDGAVVSGGVTLGVNANDDNPIKQVEYFVRGSSAGVTTSAPFQGSWNSAAAGDGTAQIYAVVEDMAGNSTTTNTITVTADNFAPAVSMSSPGPAIRGTVSLSASTDADTAQVTFERRPAGGGGWTTIGTANGAPWSTSFDTTTAPDGDYELRAIATDGGGNSGTSTAVTTKVDNTNPSGSLTAPGTGQLVGGPAVSLASSATDGGSGVASVTFQYRQSGGGSWAGIGSASSAPYQATWDTTALTSGAHDLQAVITDAAGNQFTTGVVTVVVDSTAPGVTLNDPGAQISGTAALSASTTGDAAVVAFSYSPAGASSWTAIGSDGSAPYGVGFNTTTAPDGTYDLRAVVSDAVGNTSSSVRAGIRIDNFIPVLTSSNPANGSIVASASSVVLDFSEPAAASSLVLDGNPAPCAPPCSGSSVTLNTGPLADGSHTVTGSVTDGAGNSSSFSVSFVVGVPATPPPDAATGSGGTPFGLPHVPTPTDFRGHIEADGTLTLSWTPARSGSTPLATILLVDGIAVQSFAPGVGEANLGAFDPSDMRTFSVAAVGTDGTVGPDTWKLRSTSLLGGRTLAEVEAALIARGLRLGTVRGSGPVVVEPKMALLVPLEHAVDVTLGEPAAPQTKLVFQVFGAKKYSRAVRKYFALRIKLSRPARVTTTLIGPSGRRVHGWRFDAPSGAEIVRLTMPASVRQAGRYRLAFTVTSGRDVARRTIALQVLGRRDRDLVPGRALVDVVLAGYAGIGDDLALGLREKGVRVAAASGDDDAFALAGSRQRNVRVMVVDADRYGVGLVRDLATVFPGVRIIALTNDPRRLAQAIRAGAAIAVPRSTPPRELARLIARLARR